MRRPASRRGRLVIFAVGALGTAGLLLAAFVGMPPSGNDYHPYGERAVTISVHDRATSNTVSSVSFDQRGFDTLGEEFILFASVVGAALLLRVEKGEQETKGSDDDSDEQDGPPRPLPVPDIVRLFGYLLLPVTVLIGFYVVAHGHVSPGGGFQGGAVLATALHLAFIAGDYPALDRLRPQQTFELSEAGGAAGYALLGMAMLGVAGSFLTNALPYGTLAQLASAGTVEVLNVAVGFAVGSGVVLLLREFLEQALAIRSRGPGAR